MVNKIFLTEKEKYLIRELISKENMTFSEIFSHLPYNNKTSRNLIRELFPDFKGNKSGRGKPGSRTPIEKYLSNEYPIKTGKLKQKLYTEGLKEKICETCGITQWNNKEISFELHHIDGNNKNNNLNNLKILCPNCHSQTENWRGKNIKKRKNTLKQESKQKAFGPQSVKSNHKLVLSKLCKICFKSIRQDNRTGFCVNCLNN